MIKLKTDARTPTLTYEQWTSLQDQLFMILGGEALSYMGRLPCDILKQQNDYLYAAHAHTHDDAYAALTHNHDDAYSALTHNHDDAYSALTHTHDDAYSALTHTHDDAYAALTHNHDSDYADIAHTHSLYLKAAYAAWTGDGTGAREINLSGEEITTPEFLHLYAWNGTSFRLLFWSNAITTGNLFGLNQVGILQIYSAWELDGSVLSIVTDLNTSAWAYRIMISGRG